MNPFGTALLLARDRSGMTQTYVARQARVDPSYLAAVERGRRRVPRPETISRLADALTLNSVERSKLEHLAALQRMHEANRTDWPRNRRIALAQELVAQMANHNEFELRLLRGLSQTLAAERQVQEEAAM